MSDKITVHDVIAYESLFKLAPSFLLERFAKKNTNLVSKFDSQVRSRLNKLSEAEKKKLDIILQMETAELQKIMHEAYEQRKVKQYKVFANPKYKDFIEFNLSEIRKLI